MSNENFDSYNHASLDEPSFVLRDSLGVLAVQILSAKKNYPSFSGILLFVYNSFIISSTGCYRSQVYRKEKQYYGISSNSRRNVYK